MPSYVECEWDWCRRHPVKLTGVTLYVFVLPAAAGKLDALCAKLVDGPSQGAVTAKPFFDHLVGAVLLVCANIDRVQSEHPLDKPKGFFSERDVGFFVPVKVTAAGTTSTAALVPFLYVDNMSGVLGGREIYGFPKELSGIDFEIDRPLSFAMRSLTFAEYGPDEEAKRRPVVTITPLGPALRADLPIDVLAATAAVVGHVHDALKHQPAQEHTGFDRIPLVFLKQFRDATDADLACYQQLVRADAKIDALRSVEVISSPIPFVAPVLVNLPEYANLKIADTLGLVRVPGTADVVPLVAFRLELDFELPTGEIL